MSSGRDELPPMTSGNGNLHLVLRWSRDMTDKESTVAQKIFAFTILAVVLCCSVALILAMAGLDMWLLPVAVGAGTLSLVGIAGTRWAVGRIRAGRVSKSEPEKQQQVTDGSGSDGEQPADQDGDHVRDSSA